MRYEGRVFRPPSEADSYILQATIGCSWNHCTYCAMYRDKEYRVRPLEEALEDIERAHATYGESLKRVFVADGDALAMPTEHWLKILEALNARFPRLSRISCYATARNLNEKSLDELQGLRAAGVSMLYIGPESGDDATLKAIAKGANHAEHVAAAEKARAAGMTQSLIFLLGIAGQESSERHARASAALTTAMDPRYVSLLTVTVIEGTPLYQLEQKKKYSVPGMEYLLSELRTFVDETRPTNAVFRTNHASNYLPLAGRLPRDREKILAIIDGAKTGAVPLRAEWQRGL